MFRKCYGSFFSSVCASESNDKSCSVKRPSSVSWTVNGQEASGSVILSAGTTIVQAHIKYSNGRTEIVEARLKVLE